MASFDFDKWKKGGVDKAFENGGEVPDGKFKFRISGLSATETKKGDLIRLSTVVVSGLGADRKPDRTHTGKPYENVYFLMEDNPQIASDNLARFGKDLTLIMGAPPAGKISESFLAWAKQIVGLAFYGKIESKESASNGKTYRNLYLDKKADMTPEDLVALGATGKVEGGAGNDYAAKDPKDDDDIPF